MEFYCERSKQVSGDFSCIFSKSQILLKAGCREVLSLLVVHEVEVLF